MASESDNALLSTLLKYAATALLAGSLGGGGMEFMQKDVKATHDVALEMLGECQAQVVACYEREGGTR